MMMKIKSKMKVCKNNKYDTPYCLSNLSLIGTSWYCVLRWSCATPVRASRWWRICLWSRPANEQSWPLDQPLRSFGHDRLTHWIPVPCALSCLEGNKGAEMILPRCYPDGDMANDRGFGDRKYLTESIYREAHVIDGISARMWAWREGTASANDLYGQEKRHQFRCHLGHRHLWQNDRHYGLYFVNCFT